jgi:hypothetical protein
MSKETIMYRRTNAQIKQVLKAEYGAMVEADCSTLVIAKAIGDYNPRLIIEAVKEYHTQS